MKPVSASTLDPGRVFKSTENGCELTERISDVRIVFIPENPDEADLIKQAFNADGELAGQIRQLAPDHVLFTPYCDGRIEMIVLADVRNARLLHSLITTLTYAITVCNNMLEQIRKVLQPPMAA